MQLGPDEWSGRPGADMSLCHESGDHHLAGEHGVYWCTGPPPESVTTASVYNQLRENSRTEQTSVSKLQTHKHYEIHIKVTLGEIIMELSTVILFNLLIVSAKAGCFFPTELQGSYAVQYSEGDTSDIWYKSVSIAYDYISGAGDCVFRQRDKYVLKSEAGCYKCLALRQRSYNVLTMEETTTCHPSPDTAWAECGDLAGARLTRSMLYRAGNKIRPSQCPITGRFSVQCPGGEGRVIVCCG